MALPRAYLTLDLVPHFMYGQTLHVSQNDAGRPLGIYITYEGAPFTLTGYTATIETLKPDGNMVTINGTVSGSQVTWNTTAQQTAVAGKCPTEVRIKSGSVDVGSANFILMVEPSPEAEGAKSASAIASISNLIDDYISDEYDVSIGTVSATTLAEGNAATASVTNSGTDFHAVLNFAFGLPRGLSGTGSGDMLKATYDADGDGIVDNAEALQGHPASYFATASHTHSISDVTDITASAAEINYIGGATSNIQTQLNNKAAASHTHTVSDITDITASAVEINYTDGVTSNIQTQLDDLDDELDTKISEPSTDGTSGQALVTDGHGGRVWATVEGTEGNMLQAVYDTDADGIVDNAEALEGHAASYFAQASHTHTQADISDTPISIANGGTGAATAAAARTALGAVSNTGDTMTGTLVITSENGVILRNEETSRDLIFRIDGTSAFVMPGSGGQWTSGAFTRINDDGTWQFPGKVKMGNIETTAEIELGTNRSAAGSSYIDLHSTVGSDYDGRILVNSSGVMQIQATSEVQFPGFARFWKLLGTVASGSSASFTLPASTGWYLVAVLHNANSAVCTFGAYVCSGSMYCPIYAGANAGSVSGSTGTLTVGAASGTRNVFIMRLA